MFRLSMHAERTIHTKRLTRAQVLDAANRPTVTYTNRRVPGQMRHIAGNVVAVVDPATSTIITAYRNVVETEQRADQTDADAQEHFRKRAAEKKARHEANKQRRREENRARALASKGKK